MDQSILSLALAQQIFWGWEMCAVDAATAVGLFGVLALLQ